MRSHYHVYRAGRLTVIGFDARQLGDPDVGADLLRDVLELINHHACEVLVVDLMDLPIVSSWILGVLAAIRRTGVRVELYHPSRGIREVLTVTHLDTMLHVRHDQT